MWNHYFELTTSNPFAAAFIQFAALGSLGELFATMLRVRSLELPYTSAKITLKILGWGLLGMYIKLMFITAQAGIAHMMPGSPVLITAFATSLLMNVMLGPSMMILHRVTDNLIDHFLGTQSIGWEGIHHSLATLLWLWVPLHTFTFTQSQELRIGIAAVLSLVLGVVMGYFSRKPKTA